MSLQVSVIVVANGHADLLGYSLATYASQTLERRFWELVLVDDGSTAETRRVAATWTARGVPLRLLDAGADLHYPLPPGSQGHTAHLLNLGSAFCFGEVLVGARPEVMVAPDALEIALDAVREQPDAWHTAIPYWLPPGAIDHVSWQRDLAALRRVPGFLTWTPDERLCDANSVQGRRRDWEEDGWFAVDMGLWRWLGGLRSFPDADRASRDFASRRAAMGVPTSILTSPASPAPSGSLMVYQQWPPSEPASLALLVHDGRPTAAYANAEEARAAGGLHGLYWSGHREREAEGRRVLGDHIDRYQFAASYCPERAVLDVPCGTGYGATHLGNPYRYVGLDIDAESIRWARRHYRRPGVEFYQGTMTAMPFPAETFDVVVCFEGLEHLAEQLTFLHEAARVLRPGGRLILSTPQKGVAPGTPFDRFMLDAPALRGHVRGAGLLDDEWFSQGHYGGEPGTNPVAPGLRPNANIMILVAQKPG